MLVISPKNRPTCELVLGHKYFEELSPDFKLDIESICNSNKPSKQVVNVDDIYSDSNLLGKREAPFIIVDLEKNPGKR